MDKYNEYRSKYKDFIYNNYQIKYVAGFYEVTFEYSIENLDTFTTKWKFPAKKLDNEDILKELVFQLGMVEAISYWKITCSPYFHIKCGSIDDKQGLWWKKLFYNGLGEFMYLNNIKETEKDLFNFVSNKSFKNILKDDFDDREGYYVPIGGGKDSVVTLELLSNAKNKEVITTFSINKNATIKNVIDLRITEHNDCETKRILDKKIIEYNKKGFMNGHIPFSAVVAFSSYISAYLNGIKYIALSNESSANESTVCDSNINHQYSKSYEFECDFREYMSGIIQSDIYYFSFLRPLNELQIAALFSRYHNYHNIFRSCNKGSKEGAWCGNCPKCLFVYIILSPFMTDKELIEVFGENLLNKKSLETDFKKLTGIDKNKPFECVGTRREVLASLKEYVLKNRKSSLTEQYKQYILEVGDDIEAILHEWSEQHGLSEENQEIVKKVIESV